jgi:hypothetical protein
MEPIRYTSKTIKIMPNPYEEIATFKDEQFHFNFSDCLKWLEKTGKNLFGAHFRIYPEDHGLILTLLVYAIADKESAEKKGLNLKKGILLTGPIGCGKTSLMTLVNYFLPQSLQYHIKSTRETAFEFEKEGYKVIHRYSTKAVVPPVNSSFQESGVSMIWVLNNRKNTSETSAT